MNNTQARDARLAALLRKAADELDPKGSKVAAKVSPKAAAKPVKTPTQKSQEKAEFVSWLQESAPARKARKESNADLAKALRAAGINPSGAAWEAAKAAPSVKAAVKAARKAV